jgi:nickel/cobalt transporter (NicO) family protein
MKRLLVVVVALVASLALPGLARAHPLGNFTVNHYAGIELAGNVVYVRYALDLAEIPAYQDGDKVRAPGFAAALAKKLDLRLDGQRIPLAVMTSRVASRPGAGGLDTLRFDAVYRAKGSGTRLAFVDHAYADRIGWREITAVARDGAKLDSADVPTQTTSDLLRAYPKNLLRSPLAVRSASVEFTPGISAAAAPSLEEVGPQTHTGGGFESLIKRGDLSLGLVLLSLLIAAFWGAVHALTPGHGKALVAGYLVGTKGRPRHAFILGATVTITHTAGVFGLGLVTLALSQFIVPEQLYPWLTLISGILVVAVGAAVLRQRLRTGGWSDHQHHDDDHHHDHEHSHDHGEHHHHHDHDRHDHEHDGKLTSRGILGVGVAAGLLPCPSALVVLLSAIALHRIGFGFALILAFSLGLAATITGIGLVAVLARRTFGRARFDGRLIRALPALSAVVILLVGLGITLKAIPGVV